MCTANNASADIVVALEAGANDYVAKPVDFAVALARVQAQVERKRASAKLAEACDALNLLNNDLERRVTERTRELAAINDRLTLEVLRRQQSDAKTQYLAYHDALTGLGNRVTFREAAQEASDAARVTEVPVAVFFVDLDGFKGINDTLGHSVGDALLKALATRLRDRLPEELLIARLGGDEFGILQAKCVSGRRRHRGSQRHHRGDGRQPFPIEHHALAVGASVGVAVATADEGSVEELLKGADLAMYRAKEDGRGSGGSGAYRIFDPTMDEAAQTGLQLKAEMRDALASGEFQLYFQPIVAIEAAAVSAFEALIRWQHPTRGLIGPALFIPLAESTGYIVRSANGCCARRARGGDAGPRTSRSRSICRRCNSARRHRRDVVSALAQSGLTPSRSSSRSPKPCCSTRPTRTSARWSACARSASPSSMDDFGTGFSA